MTALDNGSILGGQYKIIRPLGDGGMATVYLAWDENLKRNVALKVPHKNFVADEAHIKRFRREAETLAQHSHPNIVTVYGTGDENGLHYIVMEYVEGETLHERLHRLGMLPISEAVEIAIQVTRALEHAHRRNIVHRDITSKNVIITTERGDHNIGTVKVVDFGIALSNAQTRLTIPGQAMGTAYYISPEQLDESVGREVTLKSDIYSLGVVLYEMLTGQLPFQATSIQALYNQILNKQPEAPSKKNLNVSKELSDIVLRALEKNPMLRFPVPGHDIVTSAAQMRKELEAFRSRPNEKTTDDPRPRDDPPPPSKRWSRGDKWFITSAVATIALFLVFVVPWKVLSPDGTGRQPASPEQEDLIMKAISNTFTLDRYAFTIKGDILKICGQSQGVLTLDVSGVVAPQGLYFRGDIAGEHQERFSPFYDGADDYVKEPGNNWTTNDSLNYCASSSIYFLPDTIRDYGQGASSNLMIISTEELLGNKSLTHVSYELDTIRFLEVFSNTTDKRWDQKLWDINSSGMPSPEPSVGKGEAWLEIRTGYLHKLTFQGDLSITEKMMQLARDWKYGTPTPGGPTPTPPGSKRLNFEMTINRHNDPSLTLPVSDEVFQTATALSIEATVVQENAAASATAIVSSTEVARITEVARMTKVAQQTATKALNDIDSAQSFPTVTAAVARATVLALEGYAVPFGGTSGKLDHNPDNGVETRGSGIIARNFTTQVRFSNPYDDIEHNWDYGFQFRVTDLSKQHYRLVVDSDKNWRLFYWRAGGVSPIWIAEGTLGNLDVSANGGNLLHLVVSESTAYFFVNEEYVATLDVSRDMESGSVIIGTGYYLDSAGHPNELPGRSTGYENFEARALP